MRKHAELQLTYSSKETDMRAMRNSTFKQKRLFLKNLLITLLAAFVACSLYGCYYSSNSDSSKPKQQETLSSQSEVQSWAQRQQELECLLRACPMMIPRVADTHSTRCR